ncbi:MAG: hypothetical protein IJN25_09910 [Clostridia bacterium]|nr:hypothetical protein [Clostridia bacterium]
MKKFLALLFVLAMLFCLTACGEKKGAENNSTPEAYHVHSYSSKVTTEATCGTEGVKTFTCACGETYTEKIAATGEHAWGNWTTETAALVGKDGTQKRTCTACAATETGTTTENAAINSFEDLLLGCFFDIATGHDMYIGKNLVETNLVNSYIDHIFFHENEGTETTVSVSQYLEKAKVYFSMSKEAQDRLVYGYTDTVEIGFQNPSFSVYDFLGYKHNSGKTYTIYYKQDFGTEKYYFEVVLEYNLLEGQPNRYLSIVRINALPTDITK